ncbi:NAD dependent epimerase/dehydratase family protein [Hortaea werneckii]|nr:NAD dependent epimerase/dehydratase family protein [Hortaea werneckii]
MSNSKSVFIVGPGFIGWNVLELLISEGYSVTGFVRRKEHAEQIQASGASVIMGDLGDKASITQQTLKHDVVIQTATADHLPSAEAILDGIKQRASNGQMTTYIHTSGTGVLDDGAGMHKSDKVYHDNVKSEIDSVPDNAQHREIDLAITRAQKDLGDKAKIAIMIPPLIYGFKPKHKRLTIQIPTLTRFALKNGYAAHVGTGAPVESNIHVLDLARAYLVLLHHLEATPSATTLANLYYFCESTDDAEPTWREIANLIGRSLHQAGLIRNATPKQLPRELYSDVFGPLTDAVIGLNSRSRAVRLRQLGWKPREKDRRRSLVEDELPEILRDVGEGFMGYRGTVAS